MSTILQSCFESSQFIETTTTVKLKFAPKTPPPITNISGLSSNFHNIIPIPEEKMEKEDSVYVHPLSRKSSFSKLSEKSFEMCTENLGCETGSDDIIIDSSIFSLSSSISSSNNNNNSPIIREKSKKKSRNFPPPLTSMSGGRNSLIQVRTHREEGRLVIRAFKIPAARIYFKSNRSNGRLRLSFLKDDDDAVKFEENEIYSKNDENALAEKDDEIDLVKKIGENYINGEELGPGPAVRIKNVYCKNTIFENMNENKIDHRELVLRPAVSNSHFANQLIRVEDEIDDDDEDIDGNNFDIEGEMGMENFHQRLTSRRCNQGGHSSNKGLYNWEPLWVVTS